MSKHFATGVVMAALCLILVGCGSDGPNLRPELDKLTNLVEQQTGELQKTGQQLDQLETDLATEREEAAKREEALEEQLHEAEQEAEDTEQELEDTEQELEAERQRREAAEQQAEQARRQAQEQARQAAQLLEANQRAERLLEKLEAADFDSAVTAENGRVSISVPKRSSLTFKKEGYAVRTLSAPDLRGARLTRSRGGTQTVVVYTDIELSRSLIETYDTDADATIVQFPLSAVGTVSDFNFFADEDAATITGHGIGSSKAAADPAVTKTGTFRGSLHGVNGTFLCTGDCTLTGEYNTAGTTLTGLTLSGSDPAFKPDTRTATVPLCAVPAQCAPTDPTYMAFGWWREESTQGGYEFGPFIASGTTALSGTAPDDVKAEYNGMAVGMYVEQDQVGTAAVTKKQGEFTADAQLDYNSTDGLTGTILGFKATPTGGSGEPATIGTWVVELEANNSAVLQRRGGNGTGTWRHQYVSDGSAVVGIFESGVEDVLHLVGAFGAQ